LRHINGDWWPDRDQTCHRVSYDLNGAELAASYCEKHDLVIQAGGNVGVWPRYLRKTFANVWTFEPSTENYQLMLRNLSGVDVRSWNAALGERSGTCSMRLNPVNCGDDQTIEGAETPVFAIDDMDVNPDLIYLDVQGDELAVLQGAVDTLQRCKPVVAIERDEKFVKLKGDALPLLLALGYKTVETYGQDIILSTRPKLEPLPQRKHIRKFMTRTAAMNACRKAPDGVVADLKRLTWRHKNGAKTHFVVGD